MALSVHESEEVCRKHFKYPPLSAQEAKNLLTWYERGQLFSDDPFVDAQVFGALQVLSCTDMGKSHENDPKRKDRSKGEKMRKNRTGSRRG